MNYLSIGELQGDQSWKKSLGKVVKWIRKFAAEQKNKILIFGLTVYF